MGSLAGSLCASLAPSLTSASGTVADTVVPRIKLISVPAAGTSVSFQYYEKMDSATVPAASDLSLGGTSATLADPGVWANDILTFPTTGTIYISDTPLTASYTAGTNKIRDLAHNNAANLVAAAVTNGSTQVAPSGGITIDHASDSNGFDVNIYPAGYDTVTLHTPAILTAPGAFTLANAGGAVVLSGTVDGYVVLATDIDISGFLGAATISFTPGADAIGDGAGHTLEAFSNVLIIGS
jgi:hypothetical protein